MVVDPNMPIPNMRNPYDPEEDDEKEDEETPEITINAATQVRGNGNIISIAQMDSMRIATLIATMLNGGTVPELTTPPQPTSSRTPTSIGVLPAERTKTPRINVTVNCGATIIGDRNIIGPGLGDVARQMQAAQRNQTLQARQQQRQAQGQNVTPPDVQDNGHQQAQPSIPRNHGAWQEQALTPPTSRSSSVQSEAAGGMKRMFEDGAEEAAAKKRC